MKNIVFHGVVLFYFPGCGKTMLMDMFYENVRLENKQRIHFNAFMMDVHSRKYIESRIELFPRFYRST
jgi:predicted ATPase